MKVILAVDAIRFPLTGIGRYTLELARALATSSEIEELRYFAGANLIEELPKSDATPSLSGAKRQLAKIDLIVRIHGLLSHARRARNLRGMTDFVFHGPNFYLPRFAGPSVVTFHDLSVLTMPHLHPAERVSHMTREIRLSVQRAGMFITDSEYTRREVVAFFGLEDNRVKAAPLASSDEFRPRQASEIQPALSAYGLQPNGYVLFAGTMEPRKNLEALLDAYEKLKPEVRGRFPLVLAGYKGWRNEAIMERVQRAERAGWARYLGYVKDGDLPLLYSGARLFVYPSLYEGFGLPVLEAMASGVPVVCSDRSSLPEVAGGAAAMCDPDDIDRLSDLIVAGLEDEAWRASAIMKGHAQAKRFSWQRCATDTVNVYRLASQR